MSSAMQAAAPRKQAFLDAQEDDFNSAVDRTRITSLEKLKDVWKAAENLHARTPKSFTFRMSKVLTQALRGWLVLCNRFL